jgi:hypothetical protein
MLLNYCKRINLLIHKSLTSVIFHLNHIKTNSVEINLFNRLRENLNDLFFISKNQY